MKIEKIRVEKYAEELTINVIWRSIDGDIILPYENDRTIVTCLIGIKRREYDED